MQQTQSFIDSTITNMAEKKGSQFAKIARVVQKMDHSNVANRIALAFIKLGNDRMMARRTNNEPDVKPELLLTFVQNVMNGCCWNARRLVIAQEQHEAEDQANGVDFSQDIATQVGVEGTRTEDIGRVVEDDAFILGNVHAWLAGKMSYLDDIEDFHLYADFAPVESDDPMEMATWELKRSAASFAEAQHIMEDLLNELQEQEATKNHTEASTIDFASFGTAPQQPAEAAGAEAEPA